jgi:hypothetical protein
MGEATLASVAAWGKSVTAPPTREEIGGWTSGCDRRQGNAICYQTKLLQGLTVIEALSDHRLAGFVRITGTGHETDIESRTDGFTIDLCTGRVV